jgi:hypothetical protein
LFFKRFFESKPSFFALYTEAGTMEKLNPKGAHVEKYAAGGLTLKGGEAGQAEAGMEARDEVLLNALRGICGGRLDLARELLGNN